MFDGKITNGVLPKDLRWAESAFVIMSGSTPCGHALLHVPPYYFHFIGPSRFNYPHLPLTRGREKDTEEVVKLLSQGRSVLVLGGKGTGRRTVLADLAYRMAGENVPMHLQDKRLVELELAGILGSQVPPEQVIVNLFNEAEHSGNLIFALPDAHELAKATGSEGLPILEIFLSH
jgi:hypothetical protein